LSDFVAIDVGSFSILVLVVLAIFSFVWGRYLSKLGSRCQTMIDIIAVILSGVVILSLATGWLFRAFSWLGL
jgi:hypothetical protein